MNSSAMAVRVSTMDAGRAFRRANARGAVRVVSEAFGAHAREPTRRSQNWAVRIVYWEAIDEDMLRSRVCLRGEATRRLRSAAHLAACAFEYPSVELRRKPKKRQ